MLQTAREKKDYPAEMDASCAIASRWSVRVHETTIPMREKKRDRKQQDAL